MSCTETEGTSKIVGVKIATIFNGCLFSHEEMILYPHGFHPKEYIPTHGTNFNVGFHPDRVQAYRDQIIELLDELPDAFKEKSGGAPLKCAMCDKNGVAWTFLPGVVAQLFHLGQAVGKVMRVIPQNPASTPEVRYVILNECQEVRRVINS